MIKLKHKVLAAAVAVGMVFGAAGVAEADSITADGDGLAPIANNDLAFGTVCVGSTTTKSVPLALFRNQGGTNVFANGSRVTVSRSAQSGTGIDAVMTTSSITMPSDWVASPNGTRSEVFSSSVTFTAGTTPRAATGSVTYTASGTEAQNGGALTREDLMNVSATVSNTGACAPDTTAPTLSAMPANMTIEATGASGAVATWTSPTATDDVDPSPVVTCTPASGSTLALGTTTVSCTARDASGNQSAAQTFTVTVRDTTAPALTGVPTGVIGAEAAGAGGATATWTSPSASDAVDPAPVVTCTPASGSTFALGKTTVSCVARDATGNTSPAKTFEVDVVDTTAPALRDVPSDITIGATGRDGAVASWTGPTASDAVDPAPVVGCSPASGSTFPVGQTNVACTATDATGNRSSASFSVTVTDTQAPAFADVPDNQTIEATGPDGATATWTDPTASDLVDGDVPVTCDPASGATFALGTTTVTCSATDTVGNTGSDTSTITVRDTIAPAITGTPGSQTLEATGAQGATATWTAPNASDLVDGGVAVSCTAAPGDTFALGTTTVTCSASDTRANQSSASFTITVRDTTAPTVTFVDGPDEAGSYLFGAVPAEPTCTASDIVSGSLPCTITGWSTTTGTKTMTASATDGAGNRASLTRSYTVGSWTVKGFYSPVDGGSTVNTVKAGATVPLKLELFAGPVEQTSTSLVTFKAATVSCSSLSTINDEVELTTTGGTSLRYDTTAGQYVQNWQTPKAAGGCYKVTMTAADGSTTSALFKLR